ncbi:hypothetical protein MNBD_GAMMA07-2738 [hydrothermal vent metagenome]|uniref:Uncharacterized protein n=1 Tax=hydrothermal vent metagenome TaxID=652676 RepID=A0A3B0XK25_9ZZZZ
MTATVILSFVVGINSGVISKLSRCTKHTKPVKKYLLIIAVRRSPLLIRLLVNAKIFVAVLGASNDTFACASKSQTPS